MIQTHLVPPTHPGAVMLVAMLQSEYVGLYGEPDPNPDGGIERSIEPDGGVILLTDDSTDPAGMDCVAVGGWTREGEDTGCLRRMYVRYDQRGRHLSWMLLASLENHARICGMTRMVLETGTVQTAAIHLYKQAGYEATEPFGFYKDSPESVFLGRWL